MSQLFDFEGTSVGTLKFPPNPLLVDGIASSCRDGDTIAERVPADLQLPRGEFHMQMYHSIVPDIDACH